MTENEAAAARAEATDGATPASAPNASPATSDPKGFDATDVIDSGRETAWIPATIVEKHPSVVAVKFESDDGGNFTITVQAPRWNCDPETFHVGDQVHVKATVIPRKGTYAIAAGFGFFPKP